MRRIGIGLGLATTALVGTLVFAQPPAGQGGFGAPGGRGGFGRNMQAVLAEPFVGLTADGTVEPGLYELEPGGVDTGDVREAATDFLAALSDVQRQRALFAVDDSEWRNWANVHRFERQGVSMLELTEAQRELAYDLLQTALSERGYTTSRDIMRLNHTIAELVNNFDEYGEYLYFFTFMGEPSATEPWGWQLDGHHLVVNYFVVGDQVVMTPTFMGSEPVSADAGKYQGTEIMQPEQDLALEFMRTLDDGQRATATLSVEKQRGENEAEMMSDNVTVAYAGLRATELSAAQREALVELIGLYVGNMDDGHAALRMEEVMAQMDRTWFAWKGGTADDSVFYYRIHSPVIYIEFDHQGPVALGGSRTQATRNHIHSVVRSPNGNDYGKDLLRQHLEEFAGDPLHGHSTAEAVAAR